MLSERQMEALLKLYQDRMQAVTDEYMRLMGEHLRDMGSLSPTDVHRLKELRRVGANVKRMKREITKAANISVKDLEKTFRAVAESDEQFAAQWFAETYAAPAKGAAQASKPIERILKAQLRVTAQAFKNLSQTTILSESYRSAVDVAVQTVQAGAVDYRSACRVAMKKAAVDGLRVKYPSGASRRLDTAVRQNVLDGVRALNNDILRQLGKEYGADGVEISAHELCAEDHLPYQGRQFRQKDFDALQASLDRPFGQWNCKHTIYPIIFGVSQPAHSPEELAEINRGSARRIEIDGKKLTRYEWTQEQRKIETAVRRQKDVANLAKISGDGVARREAQSKINALMDRYDRITEGAGLETDYKRMYVAGFRQVKTSSADAKKLKPFTIDGNGRIIQNENTNSVTSKADASNASTKASENSVNFICKIDRSIYSCVSKDITTDEVVITSKQMAHIFEGHPEKEHERVIERLSESVQNPDYILSDPSPRTAIVFKMFADENDERYRIILKLAGNDPEHPKNSIITAFYISEKKWNKYLRNKEVLYKRDGL